MVVYMKTYIAGPMSGIPEYNHPAFNAMAKRLRDVGIDVLNPAEIDAADPHDMPVQPWEFYLRRDLELVAREVDRMVMLPGWRESKGARLEHHVGKALKMEIVYPSRFEEWFEEQQKKAYQYA
ncbi:hypothetical protein Wildcat_88 [Mycobacterium phage Wildcat]|uniref:Nucleoside deoxyribosyltransferase n=1 Tax=Mycobacterium phage Wildcat TaxID=373415 RepID=Q19XX2_9CAUD|nr:nucleoside 2-deoxyribosyltransferase [Mycobacterium phage Wildcat]ABE67693.1 hypothetical protein Wildcat_88 [Mycobacterium phage Wildcat]